MPLQHEHFIFIQIFILKKTPPFLAVADLLVQVFGFLCVRCFLFTWLGRFLSLWTSLVENMEEMYWIFKRKIILFVFCSFIGERKQTKFCCFFNENRAVDYWGLFRLLNYVCLFVHIMQWQQRLLELFHLQTNTLRPELLSFHNCHKFPSDTFLVCCVSGSFFFFFSHHHWCR